MKFSLTAVIPLAGEPLWKILVDVPKLATLVPGVETVEQIDDATYRGTLKVRVGPISLTLQGKIIVEERNQEIWRTSLRAEAADKGGAGAIKGKTSMQLKERSTNETELLVETDASILGKIGEFGQPVIRKKADQMLRDFVENIKKQLPLCGASSLA